MPRRASWAARMVPEKPPPTIATGTSRSSDFIIGPVLRVGRAGFPRLDMVVDPGHRLPASLGEPARHDRVDEHGAAGADELRADLDCAGAMPSPGHAERPRMLKEQAVDQT